VAILKQYNPGSIERQVPWPANDNGEQLFDEK
jgi:hypothetical protein